MVGRDRAERQGHPDLAGLVEHEGMSLMQFSEQHVDVVAAGPPDEIAPIRCSSMRREVFVDVSPESPCCFVDHVPLTVPFDRFLVAELRTGEEIR